MATKLKPEPAKVQRLRGKSGVWIDLPNEFSLSQSWWKGGAFGIPPAAKDCGHKILSEFLERLPPTPEQPANRYGVYIHVHIYIYNMYIDT